MNNVLRRLVLFSVLFGMVVVLVTSFACSDNSACPTTPTCPTTYNESITFTNDTACDQHVKIHYRTGLFSTHHIEIDLAPGASYTFSYKTDSIWSKWAKVRDHPYQKVQSGNQYFVSTFL